MSEASFKYTREQAIEDRILLEYDSKKHRQHDGNCTDCHRIGKYMKNCDDCGGDAHVTIWTTNQHVHRLRINPLIVAHCWRLKPTQVFLERTSEPQGPILRYDHQRWRPDYPFIKDPDIRWGMHHLIYHDFNQVTSKQVKALRQLVSRSVLE